MRIRNQLDRAAVLKNALRPIYYWLSGLPPVTSGQITGEILCQCIAKAAPTILEVGSNDGTHTSWFRKLFPGSTIHCFEPDERARQRFHARIGDVDGVYLHGIAIGRESGDVSFFPSHAVSAGGSTHQWDCSGSLRQPTGHLEIHPEISFSEPVTVPAMRLDQWRVKSDVNEIDLVWMDVQGAELDVFAGASETLRRTRFVYTEYSVVELYEGQPTLREIMRALRGFRPVIRYDNDILLRNNRFD